MPENIIGIAIPWVVLLLIVIALAFYKKSIDAHVDESLHFDAEDDVMVKNQEAQTRRSNTIEVWGKVLTIVVFLYGIGIVGLIALHQWQVSTTAGFR
jgi:anaerobic C4-dicarboxylate transporter